MNQLTSAHHAVPLQGPSSSMASGQPASTSAATDWRRVFGLREMGVYYALILLVVVLSIATAYTGRSNYLSLANVVNVLHQSSLTAIMAIAMTVILISGNFDLSVASVAALAAAVMIGLADAIGFWPAAMTAMLVAIAAGLLNGSIVQFLGINAFIVTLGTLTAIRGLVLIVTDGRSLSVESTEAIDAMRAFESGRLEVGTATLVIGVLLVLGGIFLAVRAHRQTKILPPAPVGMIAGGLCLLALAWVSGSQLALPKTVIYMVVFAAIVWFVLTFTVTGRRLYAVGGNPEAARLSGINVVRYRLAAFVLCSAAAGFAGVLFASRLRSVNPGALQGAELTVIAAAILGGTSLFGGAGSVVKTLAGALLLFALTNGFNILNLGANYQGVIEGTVVVTAAAIYTVGGSRRRKKSA
ncbi:ABC transporter permease [Ramlibacter sp. 2FC]|uniref:ABC transporter permease n=1 Tax=Ramlibacter sp. 2FC TaxID=2502188 RepID=UPI00201D9B81|nr:ABC transporter permease [Ramlibacter sp. 2FC]